MTAYRSLYQILGLGALATPEEIEASYTSRISADDSGRTPLEPAERSLLKSAYEVLRDPARRRQYDEQMAERLRNALSSSSAAAASSGVLRRGAPSPSSWTQPEWLTFPRFAFLLVSFLLGLGIYLHYSAKAEQTRLEHARQVEDLRMRKLQAERLEQERKAAAELARAQQDRDHNARFQFQDRRETRLDSAFDRYNSNTTRVVGVVERQQELEAELRAKAERRRAELHRLQVERQENYARERDRMRAEQQLERDRRLLREYERGGATRLGR